MRTEGIKPHPPIGGLLGLSRTNLTQISTDHSINLKINLWAHKGLNLGPSRCKRDALPLSYVPKKFVRDVNGLIISHIINPLPLSPAYRRAGKRA